MKRIFSFLIVALFSVAIFAETKTQVFYTIPTSVVGDYTIKLNVHYGCNGGDAWEQFVMVKTEDNYKGEPIYSVEFTDKWDGLCTMQFQLYDGETWKSQKVAFDGSWTGAASYNGKMYVHSTGEWLTPSGEETIPTISMHGNFTGNWVTTNDFELAANKETASLTLNLERGKYEFGVNIDGTWTANGVPFDRDNYSATIEAGSGNLSLDADTKGAYTFTWTYETNTLSIEFPDYVPALPVIKMKGSWDDWADFIILNPAVNEETASTVLNFAETGEYQFKIIKDNAWKSKSNGGQPFGLHRGYPSVDDVDDEVTENLLVVVDKAGDYTFTWTFATNSVSIGFPELVSSAVNLSSSEHVTLTVNGGDVKHGDEVQEFTELAISAVPSSAAYKVTLSAYKTGDPETEVAINDGKIIMPGYPITIKATEAVRTVAFHSSLNWEEDVVLVVNTENGTASAKVELTAGEYDFKMIVDEAYLSLPSDEQGLYRFHRDWTTDNGLSTANEQNMKLAADIDGEYTISWVFASNTIAFTFPELPAIKYYVTGSFTDDWQTPCEMSENEGVYSVSIALEEAETPVEFQIISIQGPYTKWYGQENSGGVMNKDNCTDWHLVNEGHNVLLDASKSGTYTFRYTLNTQLISVVYPSGGSALDNTDAAVKAVKTLENGQLIIEKNGKRYDVFGNAVK